MATWECGIVKSVQTAFWMRCLLSIRLAKLAKCSRPVRSKWQEPQYGAIACRYRPGCFLALTRVDANGPVQSHTEMRVTLPVASHAAKSGGAIQLDAPTAQPGDDAPSSFACVPGNSNCTWAG